MKVNTSDLFIENASLAYRNEVIFSSLNLHLPAGKWVALLGQSGVGKTSLLRIIAGLTTKEEKWSGKIYASNDLPVHKQIAYMAQTDLLLPWLSALDNALLGFKLRSTPAQDQHSAQEKALYLFDQMGLSKSTTLYPHQLSGGMRQRVALIRTLMEDKPFVLMDEPFSAVDAITRYKLQELARELLQNKTVLFVTHDPTEALRMADYIYVMQSASVPIKLVSHLSTPAPRELTQTDLLALQSHLFTELSLASSL